MDDSEGAHEGSLWRCLAAASCARGMLALVGSSRAPQAVLYHIHTAVEVGFNSEELWFSILLLLAAEARLTPAEQQQVRDLRQGCPAPQEPFQDSGLIPAAPGALPSDKFWSATSPHTPFF